MENFTVGCLRCDFVHFLFGGLGRGGGECCIKHFVNLWKMSCP